MFKCFHPLYGAFHSTAQRSLQTLAQNSACCNQEDFVRPRHDANHSRATRVPRGGKIPLSLLQNYEGWDRGQRRSIVGRCNQTISLTQLQVFPMYTCALQLSPRFPTVRPSQRFAMAWFSFLQRPWGGFMPGTGRQKPVRTWEQFSACGLWPAMHAFGPNFSSSHPDCKATLAEQRLDIACFDLLETQSINRTLAVSPETQS